MLTVLLLGLGALFAALVLVVVATAGLLHDARESRVLLALVTSHGGSAPPPDENRARRGPGLAAAVAGLGRRLAEALTRPAGRRALQRRLDRAGNPARWTAERLLAVKGCGLVAGGLGGGAVALGSSPTWVLLLAAAGAGTGFALPDVLLANSATKRQDTIARSLSDALDLLVISVDAGLGFDAALAQVARNTTGPLAREFGRVLQEMQIGTSRREAFSALGDRTTGADVRHFTGAVVQADALGVPISRVLAEQAKEMRTRRRQSAEEQAQKVPVKILFPLMALVLPSLFIVVLGPAALSIMDAFSS